MEDFKPYGFKKKNAISGWRKKYNGCDIIIKKIANNNQGKYRYLIVREKGASSAVIYHGMIPENNEEFVTELMYNLRIFNRNNKGELAGAEGQV